MTLRSFRHFLTESARTYKYKIRIAGDCSDNWCKMFCINLQKFDPISISEPKITAIQPSPYGFDERIKDQSVTMIDVEFRYPATEDMIKQLARLLGHDENLVKVQDATYADSVDKETADIANRAKKPLLTTEKMEDSGKQANKEYADQYLTKIRSEHKKDKIDYGAPKGEQRNETSKPGTTSPLSTVNRPARPKTASSKD